MRCGSQTRSLDVAVFSSCTGCRHEFLRRMQHSGHTKCLLTCPLAAGRQQWNNDRWMGAITESLAGVQLEPRVREFLDRATVATGGAARPGEETATGLLQAVPPTSVMCLSS